MDEAMPCVQINKTNKVSENEQEGKNSKKEVYTGLLVNYTLSVNRKLLQLSLNFKDVSFRCFTFSSLPTTSNNVLIV